MKSRSKQDDLLEFVAMHRQDLISRWRNMGIPRDDAEDVIGDLILLIDRRPVPFLKVDPSRRLAYLARVGLRLWLRRMQKTDRIVRLDDLPESAGGFSEDPESVVIQRDESRRIRAVIAMFRPIRRNALLQWSKGLSSHEIALELGANASTVRSWLRRDLKSLRRALGAEVASPQVTGFVLPEHRLERIAEIAGVHVDCAKLLLLQTEYSDPEGHQAWLRDAGDEVLADCVRSWAASHLEADSLEEDGLEGIDEEYDQ